MNKLCRLEYKYDFYLIVIKIEYPVSVRFKANPKTRL
jgi:hypothetical protein